MYYQGEPEVIVGKALKGRRDDVVLATKFFMLFDDASHYSAARCRPTAGPARSSFAFSSGGADWGGVSVSGRV